MENKTVVITRKRLVSTAIVAIVVGGILGITIAYFLLRPRDHGLAEVSPQVFSSVPTTLMEYDTLYSYTLRDLDSTKGIIHSIKSLEDFVNTFRKIENNQTILGVPPNGLTWEVGIYPFLETHGNKKRLSFYLIPTLARYKSGIPGSSTQPEVFDSVLDYRYYNTNKAYYGPNFTHVYDLGSVWP